MPHERIDRGFDLLLACSLVSPIIEWNGMEIEDSKKAHVSRVILARENCNHHSDRHRGCYVSPIILARDYFNHHNDRLRGC